MKKRTIALLMAMVMLFGATVAGTIAWLHATSATVTNTFSAGDVGLVLNESPLKADGKTVDKNATKVTSNNGYKLIPGNVLEKDPKVTIDSDSEPCYVFLKVEKENSVDSYITYSIDTTEWKALSGVNNVYYKENVTAGTVINVLTEEKVTVKTDVTKTQLEALTENTLPQLKFTAYAVQKENVADAATAWQIAQGIKTN